MLYYKNRSKFIKKAKKENYSKSGMLKIKDKYLEAVKSVFKYAKKNDVRIIDYLAVSKDSWYSFYKSGNIKKLYITE